MKYENIYHALVNSRRLRPLHVDEIYETHHILPRSVGGSNEQSNLVSLTVREHFLAHWLLTKMYDGTAKIKMMFAFGMMCKSSKSNSYRKTVPSRWFARSKKAAREAKMRLYASEDYVSPVKGTSWHTDGESYYRFVDGDPAITSLGLKKTSAPNQGYRWYTDGTTFFMTTEADAQTRNLMLGSPARGKKKNFSEQVVNHRKQMRWFNNGATSTKLHPDDPRSAGLTPGRLFSQRGWDNMQEGIRWTRSPSHNVDNSNRQKGKRWFNNGVSHVCSHKCPEGFVPGKLRKP